MKRFVYSAALEKREGTTIANTHTLGHCWAESEEAARGLAFAKAKEARPDFMVREILVLEIEEVTP